MEERFNQKLQALESSIENLKEKNIQDVNEAQQKSEDSLQQLRNFYEIERERLDKRLIEEKNRFEKKYQNLSEEYEQKIREESMNYEDEIENLKDDLRE